MCLELSQLQLEKLNAQAGIPHSHKHEAKDAVKIKQLHQELKQQEESAEVTVGV